MEGKNPGKPLVIRAYGSIPHLPTSRLGPGDRFITFGQADLLTHKKRDAHDNVIVQEKLDGSCCCVANVEGKLTPIMRAGYEVSTSKHEMLRMFGQWVSLNIKNFEALNLKPGERVIGEWLAYAHGTIYDLQGKSPFVCFDIMSGHDRLVFEQFKTRIDSSGLTRAPVISVGDAISIHDALNIMGEFGCYGAKEPAEGLVYRLERRCKVDFLAKFVKQEKTDGKHFPQISLKEEIWNYRVKI